MNGHCGACCGSILVPIRRDLGDGITVGQDWLPCPGCGHEAQIGQYDRLLNRIAGLLGVAQYDDIPAQLRWWRQHGQRLRNAIVEHLAKDTFNDEDIEEAPGKAAAELTRLREELEATRKQNDVIVQQNRHLRARDKVAKGMAEWDGHDEKCAWRNLRGYPPTWLPPSANEETLCKCGWYALRRRFEEVA